MCSFFVLFFFGGGGGYESVYAVENFCEFVCAIFRIFCEFVSVCVCSFVLLSPFLIAPLVCMGSMLVASIGHALCFVLYYSYLLYFVSECCFL